MHKIRLIASDLDGTLLTTEKEITPRLMQALEKIHSRGICFVPATGRVYDALPDCIKTLPFLQYVITSNGAAVYNAVEKKDIVKNFLSEKDVYKTLSKIKDLDVMIEIFTKGKAYTDKKFYFNLEKYGVTDRSAEYVHRTRQPVEDIFEEIEKNKDILENINVIFKDMDLRQDIWESLKQEGFVSVTSSSTNNLEITSLKATKANALCALCSTLGIKKEETLAMGDSDNDMDMLEFSGIGVAMGNGQAHIKKAADIITETNDNFGAAIILEKIAEGEI